MWRCYGRAFDDEVSNDAGGGVVVVNCIQQAMPGCHVRNQHGSTVTIVLEQARCATPRVVRQHLCFVIEIPVRWCRLEDDFRAVAPPCPTDVVEAELVRLANA